MTPREPRDTRDQPDYSRLPEPVDLSAAVETHDVDPVVHLPRSTFATPDLEDLARTGAIGAAF